MASGIFISYRRDDAASDAGRLADHLKRRFGTDRVFLDIDTIEPGTDFVQVLHRALEETRVVLVVIGPRWVSARTAEGDRRLEQAADFVRLEVEAALKREVPVVPVLVQGAAVPSAAELPPSLAALATRQGVRLDYDEFHDDAERLCDRLAKMLDGGTGGQPWIRRRWLVAVAGVLVAVALAGYLWRSGDGRTGADTPPVEDQRVAALIAESSQQRRRLQSIEALATLARARTLAPASDAVRRAQEDTAMEWIRNVRVEAGTSTFGEAIKPALAIVDEALARATGVRRADLLAHSGWATFLMRRDGNRQLEPERWYRDALALDPQNPYANAMLAHWTLFESDDVAAAAKLFETALASGRARDVVRMFQWSAYGNANTPAALVERLRVADAERREGHTLTSSQAQALWAPYFFAMLSGHDAQRQALLGALPPDDHVKTLEWAFRDLVTADPSRQKTIDYYVALLHAEAGRRDQAREALRQLDTQLANSPGSLRDAVRKALQSMRPDTERQ